MLQSGGKRQNASACHQKQASNIAAFKQWVVNMHVFQLISHFALENGSNEMKSSQEVVLRIDLAHRIFKSFKHSVVTTPQREKWTCCCCCCCFIKEHVATLHGANYK